MEPGATPFFFVFFEGGGSLAEVLANFIKYLRKYFSIMQLRPADGLPQNGYRNSQDDKVQVCLQFNGICKMVFDNMVSLERLSTENFISKFLRFEERIIYKRMP